MTRKQLKKGFLAMTIAMAMAMTSACGAGSGAAESRQNIVSSGAENAAGTTSSTSANVAYTASATAVQAQVSGDMTTFKNTDAYTDWTAEAYTAVTLKGDSAEADSSSVRISGSTVTISQEGTYVLTGTLTDGMILVEASEDSKIRLVLNGASITNADGPAICIESADKVTLSTAENTDNTLSDGASYSDDTLTAALFSRADLVLNGKGTLTVTGNYNNAIQSKDDLRITGGTYVITSADDGMIGKDCVKIEDGTFTITAQGDAVKSTNTEDRARGYIYIKDGSFTITAGDEAFQAETAVQVDGGSFDISCGGGSENAAAHTGGDFFGGQMGGMNGQMQGGMGGQMPEGMEGQIPEGMEGQMQGGMGGQRPGGRGGRGGQMPGTTGGSLPQMQGGMGGQMPGTTDGSLPDMPEGMEGQMPGVSDGSLPEMPEGMEGQTPGAFGGTMPGQSAESGTLSEEEFRAMFEADENDDTDTADEETKSKGIKAPVIVINGGSFMLDTADDAIHGDESVTVTGGVLEISAGDDAIHADSTLLLTGGEITVAASYEGLEAPNLKIEGGNIAVNASDDGINAAGGALASTQSQGGRGMMMESSSGYLTISGGSIYVNAAGDGVDVNTEMVQTGGSLVIEGPTNSGNGALDYASSYNMTGGTMLATGSSGMLMSISESSSSKALTVIFTSTVQAGATLTLKDADGSTVSEIKTSKQTQTFQAAGEGLAEGGTYTLYKDGEKLCDVTLSGTVTTVNDRGEAANAGMMGGFGRR